MGKGVGETVGSVVGAGVGSGVGISTHASVAAPSPFNPITLVTKLMPGSQ